MNINGRQIWEQASGDGSRSYSSRCLDWGVILNGPGDYGDWIEEKEGRYTHEMGRPRKHSDLKRFSEEMRAGDIVVLKLGQKIGLGIGVVVGNYIWHEAFSDIDGWDLQHVRRVRWLHTVRKDFGFKAFKWGDTTQRLISQDVYTWIEQQNLNFDDVTDVIDLPENKPWPTTLPQISEFLFDKGLASEAINRLSENLDELVRIANWYLRSDEKVSEAETIAYLVIPFLKNLGWTPQRMAIEWNRVDVALFSSLPRNPDNLKIVVEVKKRGDSCLTAKSQAQSYAEANECNVIVVTDGIRYGVFLRKNDDFNLKAYLNITKLQSKYPAYDSSGAQDAIILMAPG